jgi:hypothetical protein
MVGSAHLHRHAAWPGFAWGHLALFHLGQKEVAAVVTPGADRAFPAQAR